MGEVALAVDIGGTKIAAALIDYRGRILCRDQISTTDAAGPDDEMAGERLFEALVGLVRSLDYRDVEVVVCGVGCGGPMTRGGELVSPLNIPAWRDFPLRGRLVEATGLAVAIDNDAKALALAEGWTGAAAGVDDFMAMVVSTGVGGGIVVDGRLLDGASGNAGHIGHVVVQVGGRPCVCGSRGCLEAEASGTAIAAFTGRSPREASAEIVERTGTLVGRAVASVVVLADLRLVVIAGSVALGFAEPFFEAAQAELDRIVQIAYATGALIVPAGLGSDGPLVGAAAVGWRHLGMPCSGGEPSAAHRSDPFGSRDS